MSSVLAQYGPVYTSAFASRDGHLYSAEVVRHGYTGPVTPLICAGLRISGGAEGGASTAAMPVAPIAPTRAVLTTRPARTGQVSEVVGAPDGAWALVFRRLTGGPGVAGVCFRGQLMPEDYDDAPYASYGAVSLTFSDGLGLLDARPAAGSGVAGRDDGGDGPYWAWTEEVDLLGREHRAERAAVSLARALGPLAGDPSAVAADEGGLVTAVDWRPWLPGTRVASTTDPLHAVLTAEDAWLDEDGATASGLDLVRGLVERFNARLFQSAGRFHVVQRGLLARLAGAAVPRHVYPASPASPYGVAAGSTRTVDDLVVDTRHWLQAGPHEAPRRGITVPVRSAEVAYDFRPDLDDLALNGSFEQAGPGGSTEAEHWTLSGGTERRPLADSPIPSLDPTNLDAYALSLAPEGTAFQGGMVSLPGSSGWDLEASWDMAVLNVGALVFGGAGGFPSYGPPTAWGEVAVVAPGFTTVWGLKRHRVRCVADVLPGRENRVVVEPILAGLSGAVVGTPVVPEGATLRFNRTVDVDGFDVELYVGTLTTSERAAVGASVIRGEIEVSGTPQLDDVDYNTWSGETERLRTGDWADVYVWVAGSAGTGGDGALSLTGGGWAVDENSGGLHVRHGRVRACATGVAVDGTPVSGTLQLQFISNSATYTWFVDDLRVPVRIGGDVAATSTGRAILPAGTPGLDVALPSSRGGLPVGDGPLPHTLTGLQAEGADGEVYPTAQGGSTGWTDGSYSDGEASSAVPIDLLHAQSTLAQLAGATAPTDQGGGLERVRTTYLLRNGATLRPDQVVRHWPVTALALPAVAGAETVYTHSAPRAGGTIEVPAGSGEDYGVVSVVRGAGLFAVQIDRPLDASAAAGTRCAYGFLAWWDGYDWDAPAGAVYYDATALDLCDPTTFTEEVTLGPS